MTVRVKICGLRSAEDVEACVSAGADFVGFNFFRGSRRYVDLENARALVQALPPHVQPVAVFVNTPPSEVASRCRSLGIHIAQLHGDEDVRAYTGLGLDVWQVVKVDAGSSVDVLPHPLTETALMDARVAGHGGAGQVFDWNLAAQARTRWPVKLILAGGLTPENVSRAVNVSGAWGVDVASGVESSPGVKDAERIRAFVRAARNAGS